jgi:DNA-binding NtrC family response regulator
LSDPETIEADAGASVPIRARPTLWVAHHREPRFVGIQHVLDEPLVLGRGRPELGSGVLDDGRISRRHVELRPQGDRVAVRDLDSRNGTTLRGEAVETGFARDGDTIGLGELLLVVRLHAPVAVREAPLPGSGPARAALLEDVQRVAGIATPVLLQGPPGAELEAVAQLVHGWSRREGPFVRLDCAEIDGALAESTVFGHVLGAFPGADAFRPGLARAADGGTLFLDGVAYASPELQAVLLRLLRYGHVRPVGTEARFPVDVRVVAATDVDLAARVADGRFDATLHARLTTSSVALPGLDARPEDIPAIAARIAGEHGVTLARRAAEALVLQPWSGDVRELRTAVAELVPDAEDGVVRTGPVLPGADETSARAAVPTREDLVAVLRASEGDVREAARAIGVGRATFYRWMAKAGVDPAHVG